MGSALGVKPPTGFVQSFRYAFCGIATAFKQGRNIRVQAAIAVVALVAGLIVGLNALSWIALILCVGSVLAAECFNTALEDLVDLVSPEIHPLAKAVKDMAAGAVLLLSIASLFVGIIVFGNAFSLCPFI
ncbi:MAG: diacylglycerol kinase family protein [Raoultibacter sp.]